jgi:hypothetical protein
MMLESEFLLRCYSNPRIEGSAINQIGPHKKMSQCEVPHTHDRSAAVWLPVLMTSEVGMGINLEGGIVMSARKRLLAAAAAVTMWASIHPGTLSAQTSGIGNDEYTRFSWRGTDNRLSLWQLSPTTLNLYNSKEYGPYAGYTPIAFSAAHNNNAYVLWRYNDNSIVLWKVDTFLNYITSTVYGPYAGWEPKGLSADTSSSSGFGVIWRHTGGNVSVWRVDENLNFVTFHEYGPYFGYDPGYTNTN